jgi:hypothetical protein
VEIMIALAIFSSVIVAIYAAWSSILRSTKAGHVAAIQVQRQRIAVRAVEEALFGIQMFQENIRYYSFISDTSSDFAGLSFVSRLPKWYPRNGNFDGEPLRRVTFTVEPGKNGGNSLVLRQSAVLFETSQDEEENPLVLARDVRQFVVEFWGQQSKDWEPDWVYTNQLPRLVRFSLAFGADDPNSKAPAEVTTRVVALGSMAVPSMLQRPGQAPGQPGQPGAPGAVPRANPPVRRPGMQ